MSSLSPSHPISSVSFCLLLRTRFGRSHNSEEETGRCEICSAFSCLSSKTHFLSRLTKNLTYASCQATTSTSHITSRPATLHPYTSTSCLRTWISASSEKTSRSSLSGDTLLDHPPTTAPPRFVIVPSWSHRGIGRPQLIGRDGTSLAQSNSVQRPPAAHASLATPRHLDRSEISRPQPYLVRLSPPPKSLFTPALPETPTLPVITRPHRPAC